MAQRGIYCGNNARDLELRSGRKRRGNRYQCMKKGIGVGMSLPFDNTYATRYVPIDRRKIWCGKSNQLPAGYDILGTTGMCYTKGVGIGRSIKAKKKRKNSARKRG